MDAAELIVSRYAILYHENMAAYALWKQTFYYFPAILGSENSVRAEVCFQQRLTTMSLLHKEYTFKKRKQV